MIKPVGLLMARRQLSGAERGALGIVGGGRGDGAEEEGARAEARRTGESCRGGKSRGGGESGRGGAEGGDWRSWSWCGEELGENSRADSS